MIARTRTIMAFIPPNFALVLRPPAGKMRSMELKPFRVDNRQARPPVGSRM
jgi:hypothetical protein